MPRKRQIDPDIWKDPDFIRLTHRQRLLFIGLFSNADDEGLIEGEYAHVKAAIFPGDTYTPADYTADLKALQTPPPVDKLWKNCGKKSPMVLLYIDHGRAILWLPNWYRYQVVNEYRPSKLPRPKEKLLNRYPEYKERLSRYLKQHCNNAGTPLDSGPYGYRDRDVVGREGGAGGGAVSAEPPMDPQWSARVAANFGHICESPHPKSKARHIRDLLRQGVPAQAIETASMNKDRYGTWDFYDIGRDLKEIHLNGGAHGAGQRGTQTRRGSSEGAKEVLGHFALPPGTLDEVRKRRIADRERREAEGAGDRAPEDRGAGSGPPSPDTAPGAAPV